MALIIIILLPVKKLLPNNMIKFYCNRL